MHPNGWRYKRELMEQMIAEGGILFGGDHTTTPRRKMYLDEQENQAIRSVVTQERAAATAALTDLMGSDVFDNPKDTGVLARWINTVTQAKDDALVLDFFAGSGSTAHAVLAQNAADNGRRTFILVQLDEAAESASEAAKAGYATIADLAKERIRRGGAKVAQEAGPAAQGLDTGFRVLRVDSTNITDVLRTPDALVQDELYLFTDSVKPYRTGEDLLFEVLLDWGLELSMPIAVEHIDGHEVFVVEDGALIACFADGVSPAVVREIAGREPLRAVFRDAGFAADADRINAEQVFAEVSPATDVKAI
jgi:adenine-specific DNA-methyltransferase